MASCPGPLRAADSRRQGRSRLAAPLRASERGTPFLLRACLWDGAPHPVGHVREGGALPSPPRAPRTLRCAFVKGGSAVRGKAPGLCPFCRQWKAADVFQKDWGVQSPPGCGTLPSLALSVLRRGKPHPAPRSGSGGCDPGGTPPCAAWPSTASQAGFCPSGSCAQLSAVTGVCVCVCVCVFTAHLTPCGTSVSPVTSCHRVRNLTKLHVGPGAQRGRLSPLSGRGRNVGSPCSCWVASPWFPRGALHREGLSQRPCAGGLSAHGLRRALFPGLVQDLTLPKELPGSRVPSFSPFVRSLLWPGKHFKARRTLA